MANKKINQLDSRVGVALTDLSLIGDPISGTSFKLTLQDISTIMGVPGKFNQPTGTTAQYLRGDGSLATFPAIPSGTVTSVGLTMPSAFAVANSPVTSSGTLAVTGAGTSAQYIRGDGQLANFPTNGGGGSSVNYYLNGSVTQGTFGGDTYYEMSKTPIIGAGTNFTRTNGEGNGYIASFITDAGDPALLNIPGGNWNLEFYFQASSSGSTPSFYGEIYKVSSSNVFTLIASGSTNPEGITNGTAIDQYFTSIPVPQTALLATDRLAIRIFVTPSGRNITLHTENSNLCEVLTTFSTGLNALNGLTSQVQYFATGTSGTDFAISSVTDTHTFNLPTASAANRGALSSADWTTFNNKQNALTNPITGTGTINTLPKFTGASTIGNSAIFENGTNVGINTASPSSYTNLTALTINGTNGSVLDLKVGNTLYGELYALSNELRVDAVGVSSVLKLLTNSVTKATIFSTGNLLLQNGGTFTDAGYRLDVNGTARVSGNGYFSANVGIGTTSPANKLDVINSGTNSIRVQNTLNTSDAYLIAQNTLGRTFFGINGTGGYIYNEASLPILFYTATTERMRLTSGGNLLVGTTTDNGQKLQVNGDILCAVDLRLTRTGTSPAIVLNQSQVRLVDNSTSTTTTLGVITGGFKVFGSIQTNSPTGGTQQPWKLGQYNATAPTATGYVEVEINGVLYKLLAST